MSEFIIINELTDLHHHFSASKNKDAVLPHIRTGLNQIQEGAICSLLAGGGRMSASELVGAIYGKYAPKMKPETIYEECLNLAREWVTHYPLLTCAGCGSPFENNFPPTWENYFELTEAGKMMQEAVEGEAPEFPHVFINGHFGAASAIPPHPLENVALAVSAILTGKGNSDDELVKTLGFPDFPSGCVIAEDSESVKHLTQTKKAGIFQQPEITITESDEGIDIEITRFPTGKTPQALIEMVLEREGTIRGLRRITNETHGVGRVKIKMAPTGDPEEIRRIVLQEFKGEQQFKCKMSVRKEDGGLAVHSYLSLLREYVNARVDWLSRARGIEITEASNILQTRMTELASRFKKSRASVAKQIFKASDVSPSHPMVVIVTTNGMIRRVPAKTWRQQERGGRGIESVAARPDDSHQEGVAFIAYGAANHFVLLFNSKGNVYFRQIAELSEGQRESIGEPVASLLAFHGGETVTAMCTAQRIHPKDTLLMVTAQGLAKHVSMEQYEGAKKAGRAAIKLNDGDYVVAAAILPMGEDAIFVSKASKVARIATTTLRPSGPATKGTKAMLLDASDQIIGCCAAGNEQQTLLTMTEQGNAKLTPIKEFKHQEPGADGVFAMKSGDGAPCITGCAIVDQTDSLYIASSAGRIIFIPAADIPITGKGGVGVSAMKMSSVQDRVSSFSVVKGTGVEVPQGAESITEPSEPNPSKEEVSE